MPAVRHLKKHPNGIPEDCLFAIAGATALQG
jgi:hypothetical protein